MFTAWATGFGLGLSLIAAIGAQNAFVLRQGLMRAHVGAVVLTCALSDAILIAAGVAGFGALSARLPWLAEVLRWGGVAFLAVYGARAFVSAWRGQGALRAEGAAEGTALAAVLTCLAFTWLNPHVYLDTVVLIGMAASRFEEARTAFAAGAMCASFVFFTALGFGARWLSPLFARPVAWRVLDLGVGVVMWTIACGLATGG